MFRLRLYVGRSDCFGNAFSLSPYLSNSEKTALRKFIQDFKPSKVKQLHILLYGPVGVGKSSFINSVSTALKETSAIPAPVNISTDDTNSFTIEFRRHKIQRKRSGEFFPFVISDTMGLEPNKGGICVKDLMHAMTGHMKEGYKCNPSHPLTDTNIEFYNPNPTLEDKVHLLVCVLSANSPDVYPDILQNLKDIRKMARDLHIPHVAVLTQTDVVNKEVKKNVKNIFQAKDILIGIREYGTRLGFNENQFFPVRNYCTEYQEGNQDMDTLILSTLKHMLNYAEDFTRTH